MTTGADQLDTEAQRQLGPQSYPESQVRRNGVTYWLERGDGHEAAGKRLVAVADDPAALDTFAGRIQPEEDRTRLTAELTADNAAALRAALPWLTPSRFGLHTSVGFGDRLGLATPGHVRALTAVDAAINPVFAQQSTREMGRCHRTPRNVLDDATWGAFQAGWTRPVGGDADHLERVEDVQETAAAGFVFYTLDPKSVVDPAAESADETEVRARVDALDWASLDTDLSDTLRRHVGHRIDLGPDSIELDEESVLRALAKYGPALTHGMELYRALLATGVEHEVEFAVDETDHPTKPAEHVVVASELQRLGMEFVSFAPRFVGRFEKGVEFIGDRDELARDFAVHAAIARSLGPYKLSLHSGSDKYSVYPLFAEATQGLAHLKTAGTSWAEALRVVAATDPDLMREILTLALDSFEANRASYHLSCDPARIPAEPNDAEVGRLLDVVDSRQVLHVGYGAILDAYGPRLRRIWDEHEEEHHRIVADHFVKHLQPFAAYAR